MFGKKGCPSCGKKIGKDFNFCAYCGVSFKEESEHEDYGMIGKDDSVEHFSELRLPFGMDKLVNSLVKQLERQMQGGNFEGGMPKGFKINISTGRPRTREIIGSQPARIDSVMEEVSSPEKHRRSLLPKIDAESKLKRLSDRIIYEIDAPEVKSRSDIEVRVLATGMEVRAYSKNKCYVKLIPFNSEVINYAVKNGKVFLELKA